MPAILQTPKGTRCMRCATIIRNSRTNCPSCDLDFSAPNSTPAPSNGNGNGSSYSNAKIKHTSHIGSRVGNAIPSNKAGESGRTKVRATKVGAKLCPVCMNSVSQSEMTESSGQMVCNNCAVSLKNKASRGPAPAGVAAPAPSTSTRSAPVSAPEPRPVSASGRPAMSDEELLTAKGMQRQLMSKLTWIKVLIIIWGVLNIIGGAMIYAGGALGGAVTGMMDDQSFDRMMKNRKDEEGNPISAAEIESRRAQFMEARDKLNSELAKVKAVGVLSLLAGITFIVAFFMINQKPFEICVVITVLYVILKVLGLLFGGMPGMLDIFITISVLSTLTTGIRTGMRIKDIRERAEAATGRPVIA